MNELPPLFGRERELAALGELLDGVPGRGAALLLRGRAGTGRSALLAAVRATASSRRMKTLTITGTRLEAGLPFAGLHQLVQPFMDGLGDLPAPQRDAVLTAFGMSPGADPNLLFVALGTLRLLTSAAAGDPLVLLADDAQWLDAATAEVLAIIARRLEPRPALLIAAARTGYQTPLTSAGIGELDLHPLDPAAAQTLLDSSPGPLTRAEREQVLADAEGNPLALMELSEALRAGRTGHGGVLPTLPAPTPRLQQAFAPHDHELPPATRTLLLIAAASDGDDLGEVLAAAAAAGVPHASAETLAPAAAADLIQLTGSVFRFPHLLARSATYYQATLSERHVAHAALAAVLAGQPERSAWHAAATMTRPDETVAEAMELAARRALRHGGIVAALAAAERAVTLTADPALRGGRLLRAAELACDAGRVETARRLMARARPLRLRRTDRARLLWLDQTIRPNDPAGLRSLTGLADQASEDRDHDLALSILDTAALQCLETGHDEDLRQAVVAATEAMPALNGRPQALSTRALADPEGQGAAIIREVSRLSTSAGPDGMDAGDSLAAGVAATIAGDPETGAPFLASAITRLRAQGRLRLLARALVVQAWGATCRSGWNAAMPAAAEGIRLAEETQQPVFVTVGLCTQLTIAALRGDEGAARSLALPAGYGLAAVQVARGLAALGAGQHEEAYEQLRHAFTPGDPASHYLLRYWAIADLAEAAVHSGHRDQARAHVSEAAQVAERTPSPFLHASLTYARLMLASDDEAEQHFDAAVNVELASWPFFEARAQLAYGAWLRRQRRITGSRRPLRAACATFDALGAGPWAERARQELRAAGEADLAARRGEAGVLSPQELQIAEMAASGMSNREIAQQLYLSHRTVATHLYRVFPKLGITSRFQMPQALRALSAAQVSAV
jgi:DNA-binding CsgD family transcriptional regulator